MAGGARLKVFQTRIGVTDWVVAVTSQKGALKAWDVRDNLFAMGEAAETRDPQAIALALKTPGSPVAFKTSRLASVTHLEERRGRTTEVKRPSPPPPKPPHDRAALETAEAALVSFRKEIDKQQRLHQKRRADLEAEIDAELDQFRSQERAIQARVERERRKFEAQS